MHATAALVARLENVGCSVLPATERSLMHAIASSAGNKDKARHEPPEADLIARLLFEPVLLLRVTALEQKKANGRGTYLSICRVQTADLIASRGQ